MKEPHELSKTDRRIARLCALFCMGVTLALMAVIELVALISFEFVKSAACKEIMWTGSILWVVFGTTSTVHAIVVRVVNPNPEESRKIPFLFALSLVAIAAGSIWGMYNPNLTSFALWANAILSVGLLCTFLYLLPKFIKLV